MFRLSLYIKLFSFNNYFWGAVAMGAASLAGGLLKNRASAKEADRNREFQQKNSDTAYQRSMADMKKAGLNPILAAKQGGASTPSGAMAQYSDVVTPAVQSAFQSQQTEADVSLKKSNEKLNQVKKDIASGLVPHSQVQDDIWSGVRDGIKAFKEATSEKMREDASEALKLWYGVARQMGASFLRNMVDKVNNALESDNKNSAKATVR
jgi:hypothetical protein